MTSHGIYGKSADLPSFTVVRIVELIDRRAIGRFDLFPVPADRFRCTNAVSCVTEETGFCDLSTEIEIARRRLAALDGIDPFAVESGRRRDRFFRLLVLGRFVEETDFMPIEIARNDAFGTDEEIVSHADVGELVAVLADRRIKTAVAPVEFHGTAAVDRREIEDDVHSL